MFRTLSLSSTRLIHIPRRSPEKVRPELDSLLSRLHVLIVGPGLGRENYMQAYARIALSIAQQRGMFVVLDADALWLVNNDASMIQGYRRAVLTPNVMEFKRLSESLGIDADTPADKRARLVSKALGGVTVVEKGGKDIIAVDTTGNAADAEKSKVGTGEKEAIREQIEIDIQGGYKRCGGQGDVLSGCVGTILAWGKCYEDGAFGWVSSLQAFSLSRHSLLILLDTGIKALSPHASQYSLPWVGAWLHARQAGSVSRKWGEHLSRRI